MAIVQVDILLAAEIRNWVTLTLAVVGGFITLRSYIRSQQQRRLENGLRMVALFFDSLQPNDLERWQEVFHASSEAAGAKHGHFVVHSGVQNIQRPFLDLFSEGPSDDGAVERMAELFDLIAGEVKAGSVDLRVVYFQLGQLMGTVYHWLATMDGEDGRGMLGSLYPNLQWLFQSGRIKNHWSSRTYTRI